MTLSLHINGKTMLMDDLPTVYTNSEKTLFSKFYKGAEHGRKLRLDLMKDQFL